jgi:maleylpyruvate isomerase
VKPSLETLPQIASHARAAFERLMQTARAFDDAAIKAPSILPGWTRAHVLTHVARNADSHVRLLTAAQEGRIVEQYEGGAAGRADAIDDGAHRDTQTIIADVETTGTALFDLWDALPKDVWSRTVSTNNGDKPAWETAWSRWRELEIHHVDLGAAFGPRDWPEAFVDALIDTAVETLFERLPPGTRVALSSGSWRAVAGSGETRVNVDGMKPELLAWMLGRANAAPLLIARTDDGRPAAPPQLKPWG